VQRTAWHQATEDGNTGALVKLWVWAKDTITREELQNELLLAKD
jgi:hypothetical protein